MRPGASSARLSHADGARAGRLGPWRGSWGPWARRASWWGACGRRRRAAPAVRARDGLAGARNWGPRPGHALGDELRRRSGGQAGERAGGGGGGGGRRIEHGRALSGGSSQGTTLCHTGARAGAGGGCCLLDEGPPDADGGRRMRGHAVPS